MKKLLIFTSFILLVSSQIFAVDCPSTVTPDKDKFGDFICYDATYNSDFSKYTITATHKITTGLFSVKRNDGVDPECSIDDARLTSGNTSGKDLLDPTSVGNYCRSNYPNTTYIYIPYGCDKTGVNHCNSRLYVECIYYHQVNGNWQWDKDYGNGCPFLNTP
jgi:hypothetical protein